MKLEIEIPDYDENHGLKLNWEDGFQISTEIKDCVISLTANKEGLLSLASHLLNLAQDSVPSGCHMHFDEYNSLDSGSCEVILIKK